MMILARTHRHVNGGGTTVVQAFLQHQSSRMVRSSRQQLILARNIGAGNTASSPSRTVTTRYHSLHPKSRGTFHKNHRNVLIRLLGSSTDNLDKTSDGGDDEQVVPKATKKTTKKKSKSISSNDSSRVNPKWMSRPDGANANIPTDAKQLDALAKEFDIMARKDGFITGKDNVQTFQTPDATFEDDYDFDGDDSSSSSLSSVIQVQGRNQNDNDDDTRIDDADIALMARIKAQMTGATATSIPMDNELTTTGGDGGEDVPFHLDDLDFEALDDDEFDDDDEDDLDFDFDDDDDDDIVGLSSPRKSTGDPKLDREWEALISKTSGEDGWVTRYAPGHEPSGEGEDELDFAASATGGGGGGDDDMDARIAQARADLNAGRVTVPQDWDDEYGVDRSTLEQLGYQKEANPYGQQDETPRKAEFVVHVQDDPMVCNACGVDFQCDSDTKPGYLPPAKFELQQKMLQLKQMKDRKARAVEHDREFTSADEIEYLLRTTKLDDEDEDKEEEDDEKVHDDSASGVDGTEDLVDMDLEDYAVNVLGLTVEETHGKKVICKRCHGLQNHGTMEDVLRPGHTDEPLLSQQQFRDLLLPLREQFAVIIALVDLFDFSGSVLPELDGIAGRNPVILAANKVDLLPERMGPARVENWVRRELEYMGVQSLANIGGAVRLVSCKTGYGVTELLKKAQKLAARKKCDIYVVGAANAGKSTLMNRIIEKNSERPPRSSSDYYNNNKNKKRAGNANQKKGALTTSPVPGTTLQFIKVDMGNGHKLYDTPGLLVPGTLTTMLTPEELKMVVPKRPVDPITFRVGPGKCVMVGGLARIEVSGDTRPFLFTFYVSNDIKLHPTSTDKADEVLQMHVGKMLTPPLEPGPERLEQLGKWEHHDVEIHGTGWKEAAADISLCGIGWVAVTGAGTAKVRISVPKGVGVNVRPPLMPYDVWATTAKYSGGRAYRKSTKAKWSDKRRKGVARRF